MENDRYTFEDWKNGKIPCPPPIFDHTKQEYKSNPYRYKEGLLLEYWTFMSSPPKMDKVVYKKIEKEQKRAFNLAVNCTVKLFTKNFKYGLEHMSKDQKQAYFDNEIEFTKEKLTDRELLSKMMRGKYPQRRISPKIYSQIKEFVNMFDGVWKEAPEIGSMRNPFPELGELFEIYVYYRYKQELEKLKSNLSKKVNTYDEKGKLSKKKELRIQAFAGEKRSENKDVCVKFLTVLETHREILEPLNISTCVKNIKEGEKFENSNLPTERTLRNWVRQYQNDYW